MTGKSHSKLLYGDLLEQRIRAVDFEQWYKETLAEEGSKLFQQPVFWITGFPSEAWCFPDKSVLGHATVIGLDLNKLFPM